MLKRNDICPCGSGKKYKKCCLKIIPNKNQDYLNNNFEFIKFYSTLYNQNIDVNKTLNMLQSNIFSGVLTCDLFRFRVFLDSAMLLFNREKVEQKFLKENIIYKKFFDYINNDPNEKDFFDEYKKVLKKGIDDDITEFDKFYKPYFKDVVKVYNQLAIVRNALAHMNYGFFGFLKGQSDGDDYLFGYHIYNKDSKNRGIKNVGFVYEAVLHRFILSYFSNYTTYGIVYKHTWFTYDVSYKRRYIFLKKREETFRFHTLTYKGNEKYGGNSSHDMIKFTKLLQEFSWDEISNFIQKNKDKYNHNILNISINEYKRLEDFVKNELSRSISREEFIDSIKFLYDFETEFSNFLVHLIQLNDRLIDYLGKFVKKDEINLSKIISSIDELKEDKYAWIPFKYMFPLMKVLNICLRLEDDDLFYITPEEVNVNGFFYSDTCAKEYFKNNNLIDSKISVNYYILERLRNSIAHGNVNIKLLQCGRIEYIFSDIWNNRNESISIIYSDLEKFNSQIIFQKR